MFDVGDWLVYGTTGVCKVKDIALRDRPGTDQQQAYYVLQPMCSKGTIYTPAENPTVFMRSVISAKEANRIIDTIPTIQAEAYNGKSTQQLVDHYQEMIHTHDCADLVVLVMSIYAKREDAMNRNRTVGHVDSSFMEQAENLLYAEFAIALGMDMDEVPDYISRRVEQHGKAHLPKPLASLRR